MSSLTSAVNLPRHAAGLVRNPRRQARSEPVGTIVLLGVGLIGIQAARNAHAGDPIFAGYDMHDVVRDAALIGGFVVAANVIPSDLVVAALLVALIYDLVADPTLAGRVASKAASSVNLGHAA